MQLHCGVPRLHSDCGDDFLSGGGGAGLEDSVQGGSRLHSECGVYGGLCLYGVQLPFKIAGAAYVGYFFRERRYI